MRGARKREGARAPRCELLTASTAREPEFELLSAAGGVNFLALAVTVHGGVEVALSTRAAEQAALYLHQLSVWA